MSTASEKAIVIVSPASSDASLFVLSTVSANSVAPLGAVSSDAVLSKKRPTLSLLVTVPSETTAESCLAPSEPSSACVTVNCTKPLLISVLVNVAVLSALEVLPLRYSSTVSPSSVTLDSPTRTTRSPSAVSRTLSLRSEPTTERVGTSATAFTAAFTYPSSVVSSASRRAATDPDTVMSVVVTRLLSVLSEPLRACSVV